MRPGAAFFSCLRNGAVGLLGLIAGGLFFGPLARAQVEPVITYKYYPVTPEVGRSLHRQLLADTPLRHEGHKAYGLASTPIKSQYALMRSTTIGLCQIQNLEVTCDCEITLPQLQSEDPGLKSDFAAYLALLKDHEMTHCRISAGFAGRFKEAALTLGERPCHTLKGEIDAIFQKMKTDLNREQKRFDDNTRLGGYQARKAQILLDRPPPRTQSSAEGLMNLPEAGQEDFWSDAAEPETGAIYKDQDGVWRNY